MVKHNHMIPNVHLHKHWNRGHVKTFFNQAAKKAKRQVARSLKEKAVAPRPVNLLRPVVHCPTKRYNMKLRYGRGFTLEEIKKAGLNPKYARSIGIAVDQRRMDTALETLEQNVQRLKAYLAKLILFPGATTRKAQRPPKKDAPAKPMTDVKPRKQLVKEATVEKVKTAKQAEGTLLPIAPATKGEALATITKEMKEAKSFWKLRLERVKEKYYGKRKKKAELAAKEAEEKGGKPAAATTEGA